jgi:hypothetical protein
MLLPKQEFGTMAEGKSARKFVIRAAVHIAMNPTWVFAIVVAMSVLSSFSSIIYLSDLDDGLGGVYEKDIRGQSYAQNAYAAVLAIESAAKDMIIVESPSERASAAEELRGQNASLRTFVRRATPTLDSSMYRTLIAKIKSETTALTDLVQERIGVDASTPRAVDQTSARELLAGIESASSALKGDLVKLNDIKRRSSTAWFRAIRVQLKLSLFLTVAIFVVSICVRIFLFGGQKRAKARETKVERPPEDSTSSV